MRAWFSIVLVAACSQHPAPSGPPSSSGAEAGEALLPTSGAIGNGGPSSGPADPYAGAPADPYAEPYGAAPAAARKRPPAKPRPSGDAEALVQALVQAHNQVRAKHCAAPLTWSPKLAQLAQQWANALRDKGCQFGHSGGSTGENLAAGTSGTLDAEAVVRMWYDEVSLYKFPDGGFSAKTGHFTQVVWRGTTQVGCGRSQCNGMDIWVCEYDPAGNWEGQYRENVLPTGCRP